MRGGRGGNNNAFSPAHTKLRIASIDEPKIQVTAQYNPKELGVSKSANWKDNKSSTNKTDQNERTDDSKQDDLSFEGGAPRTMSVELFFDGYEQNKSVEPAVQTLEKLASVRVPDSAEVPLRRPHHCIITWGGGDGGMRPFLCVIEKLDVKYSVWDTNGKPLRATCTIGVKEAIKMKKM